MFGVEYKKTIFVLVMSPRQKKIVLVGDGTCGKTCLLIMFTREPFPTDYVPTIFETYVIDMEVDKKYLRVSPWDTAGQHDYDRLRPLSYPNTDAFVLCYAIDSPDSLMGVEDKWVPEVRHFCPRAPIILAGMKKDLRHDEETIRYLEKRKMKPVSMAQGTALAEKIKAFDYKECSAMRNIGVYDVFETAVRAAQYGANEHKRTRRPRCSIL